MCLLLVAALGSYALVHGGSSGTLDFASASGQQLTAFGCQTSAQVTDVSVSSAPKCPANSTTVHWSVPTRSVGLAGHDVTVYGCLKYGAPTQLSVASATNCTSSTTPAQWSGTFAKNVMSGQATTVYACRSWGTLTNVSVGGAAKCSSSSASAHWPARFPSPSRPGSWNGHSSSGSTTAPATGSSSSTTTAPATGSSSDITTAPATGSSSSTTTAPATGSSSSTTTAPATGSSSSTTTAPATGSSSSTTTAPATGSSSSTTTAPATGSSSSTTTASSTPTTGPMGKACVVSSNEGGCGPYPGFTGIVTQNNDNNQDGASVIQDIWNPISGISQTLTSYDPGNWSVTANMPASNTAVVSYPDIQQLYTTSSNTPTPLANFHSITSSYTESGPQGGDWEAAYDIWTDMYAVETMIWVDNHGQTPAGSKVATANINGVSYSVWSAGKDLVSLVLNSNQPSGSVDVLAALNWLKSNNYMSATAGVNQIDFGFELCSTGGSAQKFTMSQYSLKSS